MTPNEDRRRCAVANFRWSSAARGLPVAAAGTSHQRRVRVHRRVHAGGQRMTEPDVRAFYAMLGIEFPVWSKLEAPAHCFAQPDAHNRRDRSPSCSVNLASGAWNCHGCGAQRRRLRRRARPRPLTALRDGVDDRARTRRASRPEHRRLAETRTCRRQPHSATYGHASRHGPACRRRARRAVWGETLDADSRLVRRLALERAWGTRADPSSWRSASTARGSRSQSAIGTAICGASSATTRSDDAIRRCSPSRAPGSG